VLYKNWMYMLGDPGSVVQSEIIRRRA
jgi:hypothetical protein